MKFREVPIGAAFDVRNGATPASGEPSYWNGDIPWVGPADLGKLKSRIIERGERSITREGYESCGTQMVPAGSIILSIRAPIGHMAIASQAMCFNQGCRGLVPRQMVSSQFAFWALSACKPLLEAAGQGTTFVELGRDKLRAERIPLPDLPTQKAIADFLDRETARIDQLIEKKQRLVEVLAEGNAALLEQAITPAVPVFKEAIPFRWVCRITEGQVDPTDPRWANQPLIAPNHIQSGTGRLLDVETAEQQGAISGKYAYPAGTVLYSKIRPALAKACIAPQAGMCSADMYPILPDKRLLPEFLLMQLLSRKFTDWATLESMRVAMPKINRDTLGNYRLWVPDRSEQLSLIKRYQAGHAAREALSHKISESIHRLREFRSALITAAVTGQIDVTTWGRRGETDRRLDSIEKELIAAGVDGGAMEARA